MTPARIRLRPLHFPLLATVFSIVLSGCINDVNQHSPVQEPVADPVAAAAAVIDNDELMQYITTLASDEYGGREPGSPGEDLTLDFLQGHFERLGLEPMFGDSYRQPVELVSITAEPDAHLTVTGSGEPMTFQYGSEVVLGTSRVVDHVAVEDSDMVFVGYGVVAPEYNWNDYEGLDVSGKTVLILVNDPGFATGDAELFNGKAMTYYGRWTYKYEEASRQGAAAAIIIHETAPAAYGWEVVQNSWSGPQFHLQTPNNNAHRVALEGWIQHAGAARIMAAAGHDLERLEDAALAADFEAVPLDLQASAEVNNTISSTVSYNIGAIIPGSSRPDELFIYNAHWDHLGVEPNAKPGDDAIYNGARDNATGTAALIELAEAFKALPEAPERSIGFLGVTAEESGLLGSKQYAEDPAIPLNQTVGGINMDAMNVYGQTNDVIVVGYGASQLEDYLRKHAGHQNRTVVPEAHPEHGGYYRSDHFNFAKKGVPMLYAESGSDHVELDRAHIEALDQDYLDNRYHGVEDEITDDWDLNGMVQDLRLYFMIGADVANSSDWPNWYEGNEFREIRDRSRAELAP